MPQALRWLSRFALVLLALVAVLAAIWAYGRLSSPTAAQREALAVMAERPGEIEEEGENGFPLLMALPAAPAGPLPAALDCGSGERPDCLALIESAPEASAVAIEAFRPQLVAAARALHAPVFRDDREDLTIALLHEQPAYSALQQLDSLRALDFLAGDGAGALAAACRDAHGAARWAAQPDNLIQAMVGIRVFDQHSTLIAAMRQRTPDEPLPADCTALAEPPDAATEGTLCAAMQGEWRFLAQMFANTPIEGEVPSSWAPAWAASLLHDEDWLLARSAERFAGTCGPAAEAAVREDRAPAIAGVEPRWVDRVAFPVSVMLDAIAKPAYQPYTERQLDFVAQRRLLAAFLQMEAMDPALDNVARFAALPADLRDGPRPLRLADGGTGLAVPLRARSSGGEAGLRVLPLPARPLKPVTPDPVAARP